MKTSKFFLGLSVFLLSFMIMGSSRAQEITAIDFNGDLLGKVIPDGKVVSFDNELIGNVTADSLIVNFNGDLIGGVVPQGIAIGNDNKFLGKVNNDGSVRLASGKIIGKVLPSGLVVDDFFNIIGGVLFPGLIYGDEGSAIGRLTGNGLYTNLAGAPVGFVSADGYAYRKEGEDIFLEGRLISSKMIVSQSGEFIGSVVPGGKVTDFDSQEIGVIKSNGYVYNSDNRIIGRAVASGYAFDNKGNYIGFVTYNGEVVNKEQLIGHLTASGSIVDENGATIGFPVDIAATATDPNGKYLGRIMPKGEIAKGKDIIGKIGPQGLIFDADNKIAGKIIGSGPVFDYRGSLKAHALKNGNAITLNGSFAGNIKGDTAYDSKGRIIGSSLSRQTLAFNTNNELIGVPSINATIRSGEEVTHVSPFGYVFSNDGDIIGSSLKMGPVYSLAGAAISLVSPNGELLNRGNISIGKITGFGINVDERNLILGKTIDADYVVDGHGNSLGNISTENLVLDKARKIIAKILPDTSVIEDTTNTSANMFPKIGEASSRPLAFGIAGELIGTVDFEGSVKDFNNTQVGKVTSGGQIIDNNGGLIGSVVGYDIVVDDNCSLVGVISSRGNVRNFREVDQGKILLNGQVLGESEKVIGHTVARTGVADINGNILGTISALGSVLNFKNENLGCIDKRGMLKNAQGAIIGGRIDIYPAINFAGGIIGRSTIDGTVINPSNQVSGYAQPNGNINSKTGIPLGNLFKYKVAFDNNNQFLGRVLETGKVINSQNQEVGQVDFIGYVTANNENIGYALYDMYVYDADFNVMGYIAKDGNVVSFSNANLGRIDRGFLLDKSQNVIGRGNRDFYIRDAGYNVIGELGLDGKVFDLNKNFVGILEKDGSIVDAQGIGLAAAKPLQYYDFVADRPKIYNEEGKLIGFVGGNDIVVNEDGNTIGILKSDGTVVDGNGNIIGGLGIDWYEKVEHLPQRRADGTLPEVGVKDLTQQAKKSFNIALTPDGEYLGQIMDDGRVINDQGKVVGHKMPDGLVVDDEGGLIGIEDIKKPETDTGMFVPAGTFGNGAAYGTGTGPANLGPGGGYGPGERYDPQRAAALQAAQDERRKNMDVGRITSNVRRESFDGMQKDWSEEGVQKAISSWRVDMSEMILADKPIPAVIARSIDSNNPSPITAFVERNVYAEEGRNIVIPAGSRLIGSLGGVSATTERTASSAKIEITWERLIRPDGSMFRFNNASTGDAQGRGGALGYLDQQLFKRYTLPIVTTVLTSYMTYLMASDDKSSTDVETSRQQAASDARQNFLNEMNQIFEQILDDKTSIRPLTYVPAGTRIIVYPGVDLWLRTQERDEVSTNQIGDTGVLINDDQEAQKRTEDARESRSGKRSSSTGGSVVYEPDENQAQPQSSGLLIDDNTTEASRRSTGVPPPPPPSSYTPPVSPNTGKASTASPASSSSTPAAGNVPQLF